MIIETQAQLEEVIEAWGFMPFFRNRIDGFSIEDIVPQDLIFSDGPDGGAWQWKGPIISHWQAAYGKFFAGKAGYVSLRWLPDFVNWRRHQHPLADYDDDSRHILSTLQANESMLSRQLKKASGFTLSRRRRTFNAADTEHPVVENKRNGTAFDSLIANLQMGTYVCIADFEYQITKKGDTYGWGLARYCTPEVMYEIDFKAAVEGRTPEQSRQLMVDHLQNLFPNASQKELGKLI